MINGNPSGMALVIDFDSAAAIVPVRDRAFSRDVTRTPHTETGGVHQRQPAPVEFAGLGTSRVLGVAPGS